MPMQRPLIGIVIFFLVISRKIVQVIVSPVATTRFVGIVVFVVVERHDTAVRGRRSKIPPHLIHPSRHSRVKSESRAHVLWFSARGLLPIFDFDQQSRRTRELHKNL